MSSGKITNFADFYCLSSTIEFNSDIQYLALEECHLGVDILKVISESLRAQHCLKALSLNDNPLTDQCAPLICKITDANPCLAMLSLFNCFLGDESAKEIGPTLQQLPIEALLIGCNQIGMLGCEALCNGLGKKLRHFDIHDNSICSYGAKCVAQLLKRAQNIELLNLHKNNIGPSGMEDFAAGLLGCLYIKVLDISMNHCDNKSVCLLLKNISCINVNVVDISNTGIDDKGVGVVYECLEKLIGLKMVGMDGNKITSIGVLASTLGKLPNMKEFRIHNDWITQEKYTSAIQLLNGVFPNITFG